MKKFLDRKLNEKISVKDRLIIKPFPYFGVALTLAALILTVVSVVLLKFDLSRFTLEWFIIYMEEAINFNKTPEILEAVFGQVGLTIQMAFIGTIIGVLISLPLSMLASTNITKNKVINNVIKVVISFLRTFPSFVYAVIILMMVQSAVVSGTIAMVIFTVGIFTKMTYERMETIDNGPLEAVEAAGGGKLARFLAGGIPQISNRLISNTLYMLEINIRYSAVLGYVGAGGIGYMLKIYGETLEMDVIGTIMIVFIAVIVLFEFVSWLINKFILEFENKRIEANNAIQAYIKRPKTWVRNLPMVVILIALVVWSAGGIDLSTINTANFDSGLEKFLRFFNPDWAQFDTSKVAGIPNLILEVAMISLVGTVVGSLIAIPVGFISSKKIAGKFSLIGKFILATTRAVPTIIIAILLIVIFGPGTLIGVVAIGFTSIGMVGKMIAERIDDIDDGVIEAIVASGGGTFQKIRYGIIPQVAADITSTVIMRFEINVKNASILGVVGAGYFGFYFSEWNNGGYYEKLGGLLLALYILVIFVEWLSTWLRDKLADNQKHDTFIKKMIMKIAKYKTVSWRIMDKRVKDIINVYSKEYRIIGSGGLDLMMPNSDIDIAVTTAKGQELKDILISTFGLVNEFQEDGLDVIEFVYSGRTYSVWLGQSILKQRPVIQEFENYLKLLKSFNKEQYEKVVKNRSLGAKSYMAIDQVLNTN